MKNEPAIKAGALVALVAAILVLLQRFGVKLSDEQSQAIVDLVSQVAPVVLPLVAAWWVRRNVVGPETARAAGVDPKTGRSGVDSVKRATLAGLASLACLPLVSGCAGLLGSVPVSADTLIKLIQVAQRAVTRFRVWLEAAPGLPQDVVSKIADLLGRSSEFLSQAETLARQGDAAVDQGKETYNSGAELVREVAGLLKELGWGSKGRHVVPPATGRLAVGDSSPVEVPELL
jgi:hypothetical protein